jgi:hypothetical protein
VLLRLHTCPCDVRLRPGPSSCYTTNSCYATETLCTPSPPPSLQIQALGFNVLYSDLDVMWLRDPLPYVTAFPDADFLISLDTVGTDGSRNPVDSHKVG